MLSAKGDTATDKKLLKKAPSMPNSKSSTEARENKIDAESNVDIVALSMAHQNKKSFHETASHIKENAVGSVYETVENREGLIRQISPDGEVDIGTFRNGKFLPSSGA
jgi:hypothetical protein